MFAHEFGDVQREVLRLFRERSRAEEEKKRREELEQVRESGGVCAWIEM